MFYITIAHEGYEPCLLQEFPWLAERIVSRRPLQNGRMELTVEGDIRQMDEEDPEYVKAVQAMLEPYQIQEEECHYSETGHTIWFYHAKEFSGEQAPKALQAYTNRQRPAFVTEDRISIFPYGDRIILYQRVEIRVYEQRREWFKRNEERQKRAGIVRYARMPAT